MRLQRIGIWCVVALLSSSVARAQVMEFKSVTGTVINSKQLVGDYSPVMRILVQTKGNYQPLHLLQLNFKSAIKKWPVGLGSLQIYFTGAKDSFHTVFPLSKLVYTKGTLSANVQQQLDSGTNYFWIAFVAKEKTIAAFPAMQFVSCTTGLQNYQQVWADEFSQDGAPDSTNWRFEQGFVRNEEDQWYQKENAFCKDGILTIEARRDSFPNPRYEANSKDWRRNRKLVQYTASSINTSGKHSWTYGRFEMRARLDTNAGCWPAWWALGTQGGSWPSNGEIDMMEFYRGKILANYAVGTQKQYTAKWYSTATPIADFKKRNWTDSFHNWRMDWDSAGIAIYLDELLLNYQPQSNLYNRNGNNDYFPFRHPQYMLLNFAIGGQNGGDPSATSFPRKYDIDYVRVLQKVEGKYTNKVIHQQ